MANNNRVVRLPDTFMRAPDPGGMAGGRICPAGGGPHAALREIWLNGNRLEAVRDLWLPCLQRLHARENRIQMLGHLGGAPHLVALDLAANRIGIHAGSPAGGGPALSSSSPFHLPRENRNFSNSNVSGMQNCLEQGLSSVPFSAEL